MDCVEKRGQEANCLFKEMKSRRLALLVAISLGGGGFLSSAQNVSAADVTGQNVEIDTAHAPSDNAMDDSSHPFGTAAGFIRAESNSDNVTNNTLTFKDRHYAKDLFGGFTFGKGNVTGNKVFIRQSSAIPGSVTEGVYGGVTDGGGHAENNEVTFEGKRTNGDLIGGMTTRRSASPSAPNGKGNAINNKVTLKAGIVGSASDPKSVYGGYTTERSDGNAISNKVFIEGGSVMGDVLGGAANAGGNATDNQVTVKGGDVHQLVYGGYSANGNATGNTVTMAGNGTIHQHIYGGWAANGNATGNTVNLGDGTANAVGTITGTIYGGRNTSGTKDQTTGNTLNVNANAAALNIENFSTINFHLNSHMNMSNPLLTLNDPTNKTKLKSLSQIYVKNATVGGGTLIENAHGIDVDNPADVGRTADKTETIIKKHTAGDKITYRTYQFKEATTKDTDGTATWGGRSVIGNTTTKNEITLTGNHGAQSVYGGWTSGTGSTATGENAKNHSIGNKITFNGAATDMVGNMFGGLTVSPGGSATGNRAVLNSGKVTGSLTGGSVGATGGNATGNFVDINGGTVQQSTYGGSAGGTGKAENNTVTLTNGTVDSDIYGGVASSGAATGNKVYIKGGSATNHDVYGGFSTNGNATGNTVTVTGGTVQNIIGGRSQNGNATGNTVNLGDGTAGFTTGITGTISGGNGATVGKDYLTGNTLNVHGNASATNINNFEKINFHFNDHVNKSVAMLRLSDAGGTTIRSLSDLSVNGERGFKGTLIEHTGTGTITLSEGPNRLAKTEGDTKELVLAKSSDSKKITYESYIFKGATTPMTDDGGTYKDIFGGRSILGNTTTQNTITVSDAVTYRNAYGGWTSGTGSDAPADKQKNSTLNKIKVSGAANVTGKVYGGFTDVAGGNATGNEVTIAKTIVADVIGGKALGEASGNTVTVGNVTVNSITGGDGATTKENTVNIDGTTVTSKIVGGAQANGTNNTLNVKGENSAQSVEGFQKMTFDTTGVAASGTMLNVTGGGQTKVDWNTLTVDGNGRNISLLKNNNGIDFGSTYSDGAVKSGLSADKKSETNVSVTADKKEIKYTGYQFTGVTTASVDGTKAYGGISKAGNATHHNAITVNTNYDEVYGGHTSGTSDTAVEKKNSHDNTVTITGGMLGKVYGGWTAAADGTTDKNTVNLGDGTNPLAPGTTVAEIYGGNKTATGNTLNVNTAATVGKIENFSTVAFKDAGSKLTLTTANANFDLDTIQANFDATANPTLLVENTSGLTLKDGKTFRSDLNADGTKETNIEARNSNKEIVRYGYTFKNATTATTLGTEMWGGRSAAGNTTTGNEISVNDTGKTVYGGYTSGTGGTAADGKANVLAIRAAGTEIGDFKGIQNLKFYLPEGATSSMATMLKLGVKDKDIKGLNVDLNLSGAAKTLKREDVFSLMKVAEGGTLTTDEKIKGEVTGTQGVSLDYKFRVQKKGADELIAAVESVKMKDATKSLAETRTTATDVLGGGMTMLADAGVSAAVQAAASANANTQVEAAPMATNKAPSAKAASAANVQSGAYTAWAAQGGSSMRIHSGSYVDTHGYTLNVGFARKQDGKDSTLTFGPFVEYGRASYDSYLEDAAGTHGSGKVSYIGAGVLARQDLKSGLYLEGSVRGGRIKSDYEGNISGTSTSYDISNPYYAIHLGVGKETKLKAGDALETYLKYFFSHQNGTSGKLSTGEDYDFDAVNSHRLRLGARYTHDMGEEGKFYAGLAWEYEFNGEARATYQGMATPSPSLKGGSAMLELGYRFTPKKSRVSYDVNFSGWQGKREGFSGSVGVNWAF